MSNADSLRKNQQSEREDGRELSSKVKIKSLSWYDVTDNLSCNTLCQGKCHFT